MDITNAINEAKEKLDELEKAREIALKIVRELISSSGKAITFLLAGKEEAANIELKRLEDTKKALDENLKNYPELMYSGFAISAYAEYTEAIMLNYVVKMRRFPRPKEISVHPTPFLLGVADLIGELRRLCLDKIRMDNIDEAFKILELMESLYIALRELDYPDPLVPGLRHKIDTARRLIDETRALLVDIENRTKLKRTIEKKT